MNKTLQRDKDELERVLETTRQTATNFLTTVDERKVAIYPEQKNKLTLPEKGFRRSRSG